MRALLVADGPSDFVLSRETTSGFALVVATDGAAKKFLDESHLTSPLHLVVGDLDSISQATHDALVSRGVEIICNPSQDDCSDLEKAVLVLLRKGVTEIEVRDALGGRMDHTFASLSVLVRYRNEVSIYIRTTGGDIRVLGPENGEFVLSTQDGDTIGLAPLYDYCEVTISGTKWPLTHERLAAGTRGVSNVAVGPEVTVCVHSGLVVLSHVPT